MSEPRTYRVERGDSWASIAQRHRVELGELVELNRRKLAADGRVFGGQTLGELAANPGAPPWGELVLVPPVRVCLARVDGGYLTPRCFCRLRSPGPLDDFTEASGPLCAACDREVELVLRGPRAVCCTACGAELVVKRASCVLAGENGEADIPLESWQIDHVEPLCSTWAGPEKAGCLPALPAGVTWEAFVAAPEGAA